MEISVKQQKVLVKLHNNDVNLTGNVYMWVPHDKKMPFKIDNPDVKLFDRMIKRGYLKVTQEGNVFTYSLTTEGKKFYYENFEKKNVA